MTTSVASDAVQQVLFEAAARATLAPSIHNSQPWRFIVRPGRLDLYADQTRRASVIDPTGRQLAISCGAALFGVRVALAAGQFEAVTTLLPKPSEPDLLAAITFIGTTASPDEDARRLDAAALTRHSNRRSFTADPVPESLMDTLVHAAEVEGAWLYPIREMDDRVMVAVLSQRAEALQNTDPDYRAELRSWTSGDPDRTDGVPAAVTPHTTGGAQDDIPIRDFDTEGVGALPTETRSSLTQTMFVLGADGDDMRSWLIAGQALSRVLFELTSAGFVASVFSQIVEVPKTREQLLHELRLAGQPQLLLRVGVAQATPASPRRPLDDVITTGPAASADGQHGIAQR